MAFGRTYLHRVFLRSRAGYSLLVLAALLPLLVFRPWETARAATNSNVQVVNLTDHSFGVTWYTSAAVKGSIEYGPSCADATTTSAEETSTGYVHLAEVGQITPLLPATTYYYKLIDDGVLDDNGGSCYSITTFHPLVGGSSGTVSGRLRSDPTCFYPSAGALVTLHVTHNGTTSMPLAAATRPDGTYSIVVGMATDAFGNYLYPAAGDPMDVTGAASQDDSQYTLTVYQPDVNGRQQLQDLCLPQVPTPVPGTGAPTTTPSVTPTSLPAVTILPTNTVPPTARSTATPTPPPTATSVPSATPAPTSTPVPPAPKPTARPTKLPTHGPVPEPEVSSTASLIKLQVHLAKAAVVRGQTQQLIVMTVSLARITIDVTYPRAGGTFHSSSHANKQGYWRRTWVVRTRQTGVASVLVTVVSGAKSRHFHRSFVVK